jgi:cellulose synthase/poly-beta-1,6-N-acetylglucosamine synthase-like glycosyltransferase
VVDDGSTDGSREVAGSRGVRLLTLPLQQGPAAARNAGATDAHGEILLFLDADCEAAPDWCQELMQPLNDPEVCAVYGAYCTRQTSRIARLAQAEFDERYARLAQRQSIDFLAAHSAAIRRQAFLEMRGFRSDLRGNEDVELAFRLFQRGYRIAFAPRAIVYHEHPDSLSSYLRTKASRGYWRTLAYAAHPGKTVADDYTPPWLKLQVAGMVAATPMLILSLLHLALCPLFLLLLFILLLTTAPFTLFVSRAQPDLVSVAPLFALARSAALALGVVAGLVTVGAGRHRDTGKRRDDRPQ